MALSQDPRHLCFRQNGNREGLMWSVHILPFARPGSGLAHQEFSLGRSSVKVILELPV
jgi:hypothetical protein